jgi:hypothetical protein
LYHIGKIRASLLRIDDPTDSAFPIGKDFFAMALGTIQCPKELTEIQVTLAMGENEDAIDAFRKIVAVFISSGNGKLLHTIYNSFLLKLVKVKGRDFTNAVDETEECTIPLPWIGHSTMEKALAAHYGQFQEGKLFFNGL